MTQSKQNPSDSSDTKESSSENDGIVELDNSLPAWWINGFYLTIVFAVGYFIYYGLGAGPDLRQEYDQEKSTYDFAQLSLKSHVKVLSDAEFLVIAKDASRVAVGKAVYIAKCVACHGAEGQGGIGPNLTDDFWIHGARPTDIYTVINSGVLEKGMPPWGPVLTQDDVQSTVVYVRTLRGTKPGGAKAPQGVQVKE